MSERGDNANKKFLFEYQFDGSRWSSEVYASTHEEAEMKVRAMGRGKILGIAGGIVLVGKCPTCHRELDEDDDGYRKVT